VTADNWDGGVQYEPDAGSATQPGGGETKEAFLARIKLNSPAPMPLVSIQTAQEAYESVLEHSGATLPVRDAVDQRAVRQTRSGQVDYQEGKGIITDISQVGGYPVYQGEPVAYSQKDGIPDWWKQKYKLDVNDPDLASKDGDGDGYTTIEEYLNGTDPTVKVNYLNFNFNINPLQAHGPQLLFNRP
jgi:hypothetical protein